MLIRSISTASSARTAPSWPPSPPRSAASRRSRAKKADIVHLILELAGVTTAADEPSAPADEPAAEEPSAEVGDPADVADAATHSGDDTDSGTGSRHRHWRRQPTQAPRPP